MFPFGQQDALAKTAAANKNKSRRISLADRSSIHRNDENVAPSSMPSPSKQRGPNRKQHPLFQGKMPAATGACPVPSSPSRQAGGGGSNGRGMGGGGAAATTQIFNQNFELKRRLQELESMIQSSEKTTCQLQTQNSQLTEQNYQLRQQARQAHTDLETANARADASASGAKAEAERLRREVRAKSEEIAGLQRDADTASAEIANLQREAATAREGAARALEEARVETEAARSKAEAADEFAVAMKETAAKAEDAARKASKSFSAEAARALKAEAAKVSRAEAAAAAAERDAAATKVSAAADVAAANQAAAACAAAAAASRAMNEKPQPQPCALALAGRLEALAATGSPAETETSARPNLAKKRGRGDATSTTARGGAQSVAGLAGHAPPGELRSDRAGRVHDGGDPAELPELTKGFCSFLAVYTAQDLPLDNLIRLIEATPSLSKRVANGSDDGEEDVVPAPLYCAADGVRKKSRGVTARREGSFSADSAAAAAAAAAVPSPAAAATPPAVSSPAAAPDSSSAVDVTPPESAVHVPRPTTSRREMLNARRKEKQRQEEEKERMQEERERERAQRQREVRKQRKKEADRQKATEAALLQGAAALESGLEEGKVEVSSGASPAAAAAAAAVAAAAAAMAKKEAAVRSSAVPLPPRPDQDREHEEHPQKQTQQKRRKHAAAEEEEEGQKKPQRSQNSKSKRGKRKPTQLQQNAQPSVVERPDGGIKTRGGEDTLAGSGALSAVPGPPPFLLDESPGTGAAPAVSADSEEAGGVVEEVPMPTGDIDDDVFYCADVGGGGGGGIGGDPAAAGLIVGGGGDGYGTVEAWLHGRDGSSAGIGCSGASDSLAGGDMKKGKGKARWVESAAEPPATGEEPRSVEAGAETVEGSAGAEVEGKKRRRRSMRSIKVPTKFRIEESEAEEAGGARGAASKEHRSKRPSPELAGTRAGDPSLEVVCVSGSSEEQASFTAPSFISHAPFSAGRGGTASTLSAAAPAVAAVCEAASAPVVVAAVESGTSAADRCSKEMASPETVFAEGGARPAKRKPAVVSSRKKRIRANRFHGGVAPAAAAAPAPAPAPAPGATPGAPPCRQTQTEGARDLSGVTASTTTSPEESISATATVAKMAVDNMFHIAALQLSAGQPAAASAAVATPAAGGRMEKVKGSCREAAEAPTGVTRVSQPKPGRRVCKGAAVLAGGKHVSKASKPRAKLKTSEAAAAAAAAAAEVATPTPTEVVTERVLPFGAESAAGLTVKDVLAVASSRSWIGGVGAAGEGPRGALTGVLAAAQALAEKASGGGLSPGFSAVPPEAVRRFESLLTAIVTTEACAMRHELQAATEAGETSPPSGVTATAPAPGRGAVASFAAGDKKKKKKEKKGVRFCSFDLSTVDMPTDAIENSDTAAKEVAKCLAQVVASSKLLEKDLSRRAGSRGTDGSGRAKPVAGARAAAAAAADGGCGKVEAVLEAFKRGLKTLAVVAEPSSSPLIASVQGACEELGNEVSPDVVKRAAILLLQSLESLKGESEVAVRCPLKRRLAGMLSALIRYNLRVLLNPPPPKSLSSLHIADFAGSTDRPRKVHEVIRLVSDESKPKRKDMFDPTRDGTTSAVVSRALRRLYGFSDKGAEEILSSAEAFVAEVRNRTDMSNEEKALQAQRHSQDTVEIVAAIRARSFVLELLELPGVELAVSRTRGWGELERLSKELQQVKDTPDADASLTLLGDVRALKAWLGRESPWGHDLRAKSVLTRLDELLVGYDKKEAKRFSQEARRRMWFPRVESPEPVEEVRCSAP